MVRASTIATPSGLTPTLTPERAQALDAVAADFKAALARARQDPAQSGPGWLQAWLPAKSGASDAPVTAVNGQKPVVAQPGAGKPSQGETEGGPSARQFSEAAFRDDYLAKAGPALQELAKAYACASVAQLLEAHPELRWTALDITSGVKDPLRPPLNGEGPPPPWVPPYSTQAMMAAAPGIQDMMQHANEIALAQHRASQAGSPQAGTPSATVETLQAIDALLSAPANQELLAQYGGAAPGTAELDPAKVATYGMQRARVMALLERAQAAAGVPPPAPVFRGEPPISPEWLARRAELARQLGSEFEAYYQQARGTSAPARGSLSAEPMVRNNLWVRFIATNATAGALARHLGLEGAAALPALLYSPGACTRLSDVSWRGGPTPPGTAMGTAETLGSVDLLLSDPDNQALIRNFGGPAPEPNGGLAHEQVRLFGLTRYQAMTQLSTAMAAVRQDYLVQLNNARADAARPEVAATLPFLKDGKFSVESFTAWYAAQPGTANQAFAKLVGPVTGQVMPDPENGQLVYFEFGQSHLRLTSTVPQLGAPSYFKFEARGPADHGSEPPSIVTLDPQAPPELNDFSLLGFDSTLGWITPQQNIHREESTGGQILQGVVIGSIMVGFAWAAGTVAAAAATGTSVGAAATGIAQGTMSLTGMVAAGAASGATAAVLNGVIGQGTFRWKDVLKGSFTGAFTSGLATCLRDIAAIRQFALANPVAYSTVLSGGTQALLGESFKQGLLVGFANGVAGQVTAKLNDVLAHTPNLSPAEIASARMFIKALDSAIRIAADPSNPSQAFASNFLSSVINDPDLHPALAPETAPVIWDSDQPTWSDTVNAAAAEQGIDAIVGPYDPSLDDAHLVDSSIAHPTNTLEAGIQQAILRGDAQELRLLLGEANLTASDMAIAQRTLTVIESVSPQEARLLAERYGVDLGNKLAHIFENSLHDHGLTALVEASGTVGRAFLGVQAAIDSLSLPAGVFQRVVSVSGVNITVRGIVINGVARINTMFIP